jgi:sporulation protein YlmC with PRC-barrel domain
MPPDHAFDIDSTVGRYWLANGSGFEIVERGGRRLGVVEDVVLDPSTQRVDAMVVKRRAAIGRKRVPPHDLTTVVPAARRFVVAAGSSEALTHATGRAVASSASAEVRHLFGATATGVRHLLSASAPVVAAGARWLVAAAAAAGRELVAIAASSRRFVRAHWPAVRRFLGVAGVTAVALARFAGERSVRGARHALGWLRAR